MNTTPSLSAVLRRLVGGIVMLAMMVATAFAAEQTFSTTVSGNCGSCKKRIVKAAESVDGVKNAQWDKKSKQLTVTFDDAKTSRDAVVRAVVAVGHDADTLKADDDVYKRLPECCSYRDNAKTH